MPQGGVAPRLEQEWKISIGNTISGDDFEVIGGTWTVDNGAIRSLGEQNNHPLWLKRRIPDAFEISFEASTTRLSSAVTGCVTSQVISPSWAAGATRSR
jgi:hypothetical protein